MNREEILANLEVYLEQACDSSKEEFDISAVDAFCHLLKNEPELSANAARMIATKIQSQNLKECLFALDCLEECMDTLGTNFQIEINKFKFLNELIRLVSKKFLGDKTPQEIKDRILDILFTWNDKYPELGKVKEAYTMLRTQGVVHEPQKNVIAPASKKSTDNTLKLMESEKFKRLLQSKNQKDIEAANLMIQNMVRDNDRRIQIQNRRLFDLQSANENSILLKEMLDEFDPNEASEDTITTLREIYNNCVKLKPTVCRLAEESHDSESFMNQIIETNELLNKTIELYTAIIINKAPIAKKDLTTLSSSVTTDLLDVADLNASSSSSSTELASNETLSVLNDIFSTVEPPKNNAQLDSTLLTPQIVSSSSSTLNTTTKNSIDIIALINSQKPLVMNDIIENESASKLQESPSRNASGQNVQQKHTITEKTKLRLSELDTIITGMKSQLLLTGSDQNDIIQETSESVKECDDMILTSEISQDEENPPTSSLVSVNEIASNHDNLNKKIALKDITLDINEIQPSEIEAPRTILDEKKGLKVVVNFAKDRPANDVIVLVISIVNQGPIAIENFQFDASVSKPCKLRILEASGRNLPALKPFKIPTEIINQVLILYNPTRKLVDMIAILTYSVEGDEDEEKLSIEIKDIPFIS